MFGLRAPELLIILAVLLLLFGASRLPQLAKSLGSSVRNFKKGISSDDEEEEAVANNANNKASAKKNLEANASASASEVDASKLGSKKES